MSDGRVGDLQQLTETIQILTERGRQNTLTLAHISAMVRDILVELRKPAPEDNPLVDALKALVAVGNRHEDLLKRLASGQARIETALRRETR
jgi:hypothetical protein